MIVLGVDVPGPWRGGLAIYNVSDDDVELTECILFEPTDSEAECLQWIWERLDQLHEKWEFDLVAIEHPFLHRIQQWIGAVKMWAAVRCVPWFMINASMAEKAVWGAAIRRNKAGVKIKGKARKDEIMRRIRRRYFPGRKNLTQHEVDAVLYAIGAAKRQSVEHQTKV